ncbi:tumor necrosis factor receptor superfamily member 9-like [Hypomesus transpacificus]|uniref:tumor necrosis factor receptor superfamily member 9-like n=1 Tax=Hypomesus transpacificus TaxID=137520 RepID=UPI001F079528|nr:tumor necrosis factor receptor superfamily member 9-like [Hypomesus transpacificus]
MLGVIYSPTLNPVRAMDLLILAWCFALLPAGCISAEETAIGCMRWEPHKTTDVCCVHCKPGNRVVSRCGPDPKELCTPCEEGTYTKDPLKFDCKQCTTCTGAFILKKRCTTTKDTECDCSAGYKCGDEGCTFCVKECGKGEEPTNQRSCQKCPQGTFNDQIHQKCKPWTTRCPHPNQHIVASGDAVSDIKCSTSKSNHSDPVVVTLPSRNTGISFVPENRDNTGWVVAVTCAGFLVIVISIISSIMLHKSVQKKLPPKTPNPFGPIIRNPTTDEPQTLVSCSCHQPQQEQGSSTESLTSQESKAPLLNEIRLNQTP